VPKKRKIEKIPLEKIKEIERGNYYNLPIIFKAKYQSILLFAIAYLNLCALGVGCFLLNYVPITNIDFSKESIIVAIFCFMFLAIILFLDIDFIHSAILRRQYVKMNLEGIVIKKLFTKKIIKWSEIYTIDIYTYRMAETIRFIRKKDLDSGLKVFFMDTESSGAVFGMKINRRKYSNIDVNRMMSTVRNNIKNK